MSIRTYTKRPCGLCGKVIKSSGLAMASHMSVHVKAGEVFMWEKQGQKVYYSKGEDPAKACGVSFYF